MVRHESTPTDRPGRLPAHFSNATAISPSGRPEPQSLRDVIDAAIRLERIGLSLSRWFPENREFAGACVDLFRMTDRAELVAHAWRAEVLAAHELTIVVEDFRSTIEAQCKVLLDALVLFIQHHGWVQERYAPLCRKAATLEVPCKRCGGQSRRTRYEHFTDYLPAIERDDCDHTHHRHQTVGNAVELRPATLRVKSACVSVSLPPLLNGSQGAIFHRMPALTPLAWPYHGGEDFFATTRLSFRGRLTLVAAALSIRTLLRCSTTRSLSTPTQKGSLQRLTKYRQD